MRTIHPVRRGIEVAKKRPGTLRSDEGPVLHPSTPKDRKAYLDSGQLDDIALAPLFRVTLGGFLRV